MKTHVKYRLYGIIWLLLFAAGPVMAGDVDVLNRIIKLPKSKNTTYYLLGQVSQQAGFLFIYDSKLVDNEKVVKMKGGKYTIRQAIYEITGNNRLALRIIGNHILISQPADSVATVKAPETNPPDSSRYFTLEGILLDKLDNTPIPYGTVGVVGTSIGSVTNQNGEFRLHLPDSLRQSNISFSHLGYCPQEIEASLLAGRHSSQALEPKVIPIQEVVVRIVNPLRLLRELLENREKNYAQEPVCLTTFYREGIECKNRFVSLTEAIFKIYKAPYLTHQNSDQVKLLKMRRISNEREKDTLATKMKAGINASLMLDMMKNQPEFILPEYEYIYTYASTDIVVIDDRLANVIYFEQREHIKEPLFRGELFIDSESSALLRARFEVNPRYINKATGMFIERKSKHIDITPHKVEYTVSYKLWNGTYYMSHVRGDLHFKVKKKRQLFGNMNLHAWFEMVTCKIDTEQVSRFTRRELLPTRTIFSDTNFTYDESFWGDFNVIPPEEKLNEAISKIYSKIEEIGY